MVGGDLHPHFSGNHKHKVIISIIYRLPYLVYVLLEYLVRVVSVKSAFLPLFCNDDRAMGLPFLNRITSFAFKLCTSQFQHTGDTNNCKK